MVACTTRARIARLFVRPTAVVPGAVSVGLAARLAFDGPLADVSAAR
jgi:hypothetical protein